MAFLDGRPARAHIRKEKRLPAKIRVAGAMTINVFSRIHYSLFVMETALQQGVLFRKTESRTIYKNRDRKSYVNNATNLIRFFPYHLFAKTA